MLSPDHARRVLNSVDRLSRAGDWDWWLVRFVKTPVLRYSEEPGFTGERPGSSEYLRTGVERRNLDF
jgi:hypothetical protein